MALDGHEPGGKGLTSISRFPEPEHDQPHGLLLTALVEVDDVSLEAAVGPHTTSDASELAAPEHGRNRAPNQPCILISEERGERAIMLEEVSVRGQYRHGDG